MSQRCASSTANLQLEGEYLKESYPRDTDTRNRLLYLLLVLVRIQITFKTMKILLKIWENSIEIFYWKVLCLLCVGVVAPALSRRVPCVAHHVAGFLSGVWSPARAEVVVVFFSHVCIVLEWAVAPRRCCRDSPERTECRLKADHKWVFPNGQCAFWWQCDAQLDSTN